MKVILPYLTIQEKSKNNDPKVAYKIVKKNYCSRMVNAGICPLNCLMCSSNLDEMLDVGNANKPAALLTWKARNYFAKEQELHSKRQKIVKPKSFMDAFVKKAGNPFLDLLNSIEEA